MSKYLFYNNDNKDQINLDIEDSEILRYLGLRNNPLDIKTKSLLEDSIVEIKKISGTKYVYNIFPLEKKDNKILLNNSIIELEGRDIYEHLKDSEKVAVMAVTLGIEVEKRIKYYSMTDLSKGIIFDSCATALVEKLCDYVQEKIKIVAETDGYNITSRYSPGYGDLPLSIQNQILNSLNTQRLIGLTATESSILIPRKSVTAFIGFTTKKTHNKKNCKDRNLYGNCKYSKEGEINCVK